MRFSSAQWDTLGTRTLITGVCFHWQPCHHLVGGVASLRDVIETRYSVSRRRNKQRENSGGHPVFLLLFVSMFIAQSRTKLCLRTGSTPRGETHPNHWVGVTIRSTKQHITVGSAPVSVVRFSSGWYPDSRVTSLAQHGSLKGSVHSF